MIRSDRRDVFADLPAGACVVPGNVCGTPLTLLSALADHAQQGHHVELITGLTLGDPPLEPAIRSGNLRLRSWHIHGGLRRLYREGLVDYLPIRLLDVADTVLTSADVALIRVGPPDADGFCSLGPSASFAEAAVDRAPLVIAEVADDVPRTHGEARIHESRIDRFVQSEDPMARHEAAPTDPTSDAVAAHINGILPDGCTLQLGIGAVPEALATTLTSEAGERGLGLVGLVTDSMTPLVEAIVATTHEPVLAVELMGTPGLMTWAHENPMVELRGSRHLHNPTFLSRIPQLISVNSAVAVDTRGQVVAESVRGSVIAGVGGSADFAEGAHLSPGGLRVIALKSTTRNGNSTIVAAHDPADAVTTAHHGVDVVVTEHGVAWLRGRTQRQRRAALTAVAAPEHRDALASASEGTP